MVARGVVVLSFHDPSAVHRHDHFVFTAPPAWTFRFHPAGVRLPHAERRGLERLHHRQPLRYGKKRSQAISIIGQPLPAHGEEMTTSCFAFGLYHPFSFLSHFSYICRACFMFFVCCVSYIL